MYPGAQSRMTGRSGPNDRARMTGKAESNVTQRDNNRTFGSQSPPGHRVALESLGSSQLPVWQSPVTGDLAGLVVGPWADWPVATGDGWEPSRLLGGDGVCAEVARAYFRHLPGGRAGQRRLPGTYGMNPRHWFRPAAFGPGPGHARWPAHHGRPAVLEIPIHARRPARDRRPGLAAPDYHDWRPRSYDQSQAVSASGVRMGGTRVIRFEIEPELSADNTRLAGYR